MKAKIEIREYVWVHGHAPGGIGAWAFGFRPHAPAAEMFFAPGLMPLGEARKLARAEAARRGAAIIYLGA